MYTEIKEVLCDMVELTIVEEGSLVLATIVKLKAAWLLCEHLTHEVLVCCTDFVMREHKPVNPLKQRQDKVYVIQLAAYEV